MKEETKTEVRTVRTEKTEGYTAVNKVTRQTDEAYNDFVKGLNTTVRQKTPLEQVFRQRKLINLISSVFNVLEKENLKFRFGRVAEVTINKKHIGKGIAELYHLANEKQKLGQLPMGSYCTLTKTGIRLYSEALEVGQ